MDMEASQSGEQLKCWQEVGTCTIHILFTLYRYMLQVRQAAFVADCRKGVQGPTMSILQCSLNDHWAKPVIRPWRSALTGSVTQLYDITFAEKRGQGREVVLMEYRNR